MVPYVCEGTIVKNRYGQEGKVIGVDRKNKLAAVQINKSICSEKLEHLQVISYKGVK